MDDAVGRVLEERWASLIDSVERESATFAESLRPIVAAAAANSELRALFPFTSVGRLCFSRCSEYPYTVDCPCIAHRRGRCWVQATWAVTDEDTPVIAETTDVDEAIRVVVANLPAERHVWLGSSEG